MKFIKTVLPGLGITLVVLVVLHTVSLPSHNRLWREVANFGHIPLFGLLAVTVLHLSKTLLNTKFKNQFQHWLLALIVVTVIGGLSEFVQIAGPRDADWGDLLRDIMGALIFLGFAATMSAKRFPTLGTVLTTKSKWVVYFATSVLLFVTLTPLFYWSVAFFNRSQQFPLLCGFESFWEYGFVGSNSGRVEFVEAPSGWESSNGDKEETARVGRVRFDQIKYAGFFISEPYPDFSGHDTLSIELFSSQDSAIALTVRIDDRSHNYKFNDRYNRKFIIRPGMNKILIPCDDIRYAPANRNMDMTAIASIHIFSAKPAESFVLFFDNLQLY